MGEPERRLGALVAALGEGCSPGYTLSQSLGRIQGESVEEGVKRDAKFVEKLAQMWYNIKNAANPKTETVAIIDDLCYCLLGLNVNLPHEKRKYITGRCNP